MGSSWIKDPGTRPSEQRRQMARTLRRTLTEPERRLWWHLRKRLPLEGSHFRRQVNIGRYIVDFCCLQARLVIEVDGNQHGLDANVVRDRERTRYLEGQGFRVIRFSNAEVMTAMGMVLDRVLAAMQGSFPENGMSIGESSIALGSGPTPPTPNPSPQGGGEQERPA